MYSVTEKLLYENWNRQVDPEMKCEVDCPTGVNLGRSCVSCSVKSKVYI